MRPVVILLLLAVSTVTATAGSSSEIFLQSLQLSVLHDAGTNNPAPTYRLQIEATVGVHNVFAPARQSPTLTPPLTLFESQSGAVLNVKRRSDYAHPGAGAEAVVDVRVAYAATSSSEPWTIDDGDGEDILIQIASGAQQQPHVKLFPALAGHLFASPFHNAFEQHESGVAISDPRCQANPLFKCCPGSSSSSTATVFSLGFNSTPIHCTQNEFSPSPSSAVVSAEFGIHVFAAAASETVNDTAVANADIGGGLSTQELSSSVVSLESASSIVAVNVSFDFGSTASTAISSLQQLASSLDTALQNEQDTRGPMRLCLSGDGSSFLGPLDIFGSTSNKLGMFSEEYVGAKNCSELGPDLTSIPLGSHTLARHPHNQLAQVVDALSVQKLLPGSSSCRVVSMMRLNCSNDEDKQNLQLRVTTSISHPQLQRLFPVNVVISAQSFTTPQPHRTVSFCLDVWNRGDVASPRGSLFLVLKQISPPFAASFFEMDSAVNVIEQRSVAIEQYHARRFCLRVLASIPEALSVINGSATLELHDAFAHVIATVHGIAWRMDRTSKLALWQRDRDAESQQRRLQHERWLVTGAVGAHRVNYDLLPPRAVVLFSAARSPPGERGDTVHAFRQQLQAQFPDDDTTTTTPPLPDCTDNDTSSSSHVIIEQQVTEEHAAEAKFIVSAVFISLACVVWAGVLAAVILLARDSIKTPAQKEEDDEMEMPADGRRSREGSPYFELTEPAAVAAASERSSSCGGDVAIWVAEQQQQQKNDNKNRSSRCRSTRSSSSASRPRRAGSVTGASSIVTATSFAVSAPPENRRQRVPSSSSSPLPPQEILTLDKTLSSSSTRSSNINNFYSSISRRRNVEEQQLEISSQSSVIPHLRRNRAFSLGAASSLAPSLTPPVPPAQQAESGPRSVMSSSLNLVADEDQEEFCVG